MKRANYLIIATLAMSLSSLSAAQTFAGTTTGAPTWTRPIANGNAPPTSLSGVGVNVPYQATLVSVSASGSYTFDMVAATGWDTYAFLYTDPFSSVAPLTNILIGNDDEPNSLNSRFSLNLTSGTQYVFVGTGFDSVEFGDYRLEVTSQVGTATFGAVPEPASMTALAVGGLALLRRRRASK